MVLTQTPALNFLIVPVRSSKRVSAAPTLGNYLNSKRRGQTDETNVNSVQACVYATQHPLHPRVHRRSVNTVGVTSNCTVQQLRVHKYTHTLYRPPSQRLKIEKSHSVVTEAVNCTKTLSTALHQHNSLK